MADEKLYLWEHGKVPYFNEEYNQEEPSLKPFLIHNGKKNGCVIVCAGGAYFGSFMLRSFVGLVNLSSSIFIKFGTMTETHRYFLAKECGFCRRGAAPQGPRRSRGGGRRSRTARRDDRSAALRGRPGVTETGRSGGSGRPRCGSAARRHCGPARRPPGSGSGRGAVF